MMKLVAILCATLGALLVVWLVVGPSLADTAFHVSGHSVSWTLVAGGLLGFVLWRIVKGK